MRLKRGFGPKPLRSESEPDGIAGLWGKDLEGVVVASKLYQFVAELVAVLEDPVYDIVYHLSPYSYIYIYIY